MNQIDAYRLSHPELLSEKTLSEILENSCIVLPAFGSLCKEELIEIFKRIALPMPQRRYNDSTTLGKTLNNLRVAKGIDTAVYSENFHVPSATSPLAEIENKTRVTDDSVAKARLKPPISDDLHVCKKIRLSDSCHSEILFEKGGKRENEDSSLPDAKKRQKITWP